MFINRPDMESWVCPPNFLTPDFIICGAMKCGTTTIHQILDSHPDVFIPNPEVHFFDTDDIFQHSDFYQYDNQWFWPNICQDPKRYWEWYNNFFSEAKNGQIIGEDSTCYLPSARAAERIAAQNKPIKIIVCLRDPASRAYSQYLHMLRTGRAIFSFEDTIRFNPNDVLYRSMYFEQISRLFSYIPRERVFVFVLEDFLHDKIAVVSKLSRFLGIDYNDFPEGAVDIHANKAVRPLSLSGEVIFNRMFRSLGNRQYIGKLPFDMPKSKLKHHKSLIFKKLRRLFNPYVKLKEPPMKAETRRFLNSFFQNNQLGINELTGVEVDRYWYK